MKTKPAANSNPMKALTVLHPVSVLVRKKKAKGVKPNKTVRFNLMVKLSSSEETIPEDCLRNCKFGHPCGLHHASGMEMRSQSSHDVSGCSKVATDTIIPTRSLTCIFTASHQCSHAQFKQLIKKRFGPSVNGYAMQSGQQNKSGPRKGILKYSHQCADIFKGNLLECSNSESSLKIPVHLTSWPSAEVSDSETYSQSIWSSAGLHDPSVTKPRFVWVQPLPVITPLQDTNACSSVQEMPNNISFDDLTASIRALQISCESNADSLHSESNNVMIMRPRSDSDLDRNESSLTYRPQDFTFQEPRNGDQSYINKGVDTESNSSSKDIASSNMNNNAFEKVHGPQEKANDSSYKSHSGHCTCPGSSKPHANLNSLPVINLQLNTGWRSGECNEKEETFKEHTTKVQSPGNHVNCYAGRSFGQTCHLSNTSKTSVSLNEISKRNSCQTGRGPLESKSEKLTTEVMRRKSLPHKNQACVSQCCGERQYSPNHNGQKGVFTACKKQHDIANKERKGLHFLSKNKLEAEGCQRTNRAVQMQKSTVESVACSSSREPPPPDDILYRCPVLNCAMLFTHKTFLTEHMNQLHHSPCNPSSTLINGIMPETQGWLCPLCGCDFTDEDACLEHMLKQNHSRLMSPVPFSVYACPQCLCFFPTMSSASQHMETMAHFNSIFSFECRVHWNPYDINNTNRAAPIPVPQRVSQELLTRCKNVDYDIFCENCRSNVKASVDLKDHIDKCHLLMSKCGKSVTDVFSTLITDQACAECRQFMYNDFPETELCVHTDCPLQGPILTSRAHSLKEFILRCGITETNVGTQDNYDLSPEVGLSISETCTVCYTDVCMEELSDSSVRSEHEEHANYKLLFPQSSLNFAVDKLSSSVTVTEMKSSVSLVTKHPSNKDVMCMSSSQVQMSSDLTLSRNAVSQTSIAQSLNLSNTRETFVVKVARDGQRRIESYLCKEKSSKQQNLNSEASLDKDTGEAPNLSLSSSVPEILHDQINNQMTESLNKASAHLGKTKYLNSVVTSHVNKCVFSSSESLTSCGETENLSRSPSAMSSAGTSTRSATSCDSDVNSCEKCDSENVTSDKWLDSASQTLGKAGGVVSKELQCCILQRNSNNSMEVGKDIGVTLKSALTSNIQTDACTFSNKQISFPKNINKEVQSGKDFFCDQICREQQPSSGGGLTTKSRCQNLQVHAKYSKENSVFSLSSCSTAKDPALLGLICESQKTVQPTLRCKEASLHSLTSGQNVTESINYGGWDTSNTDIGSLALPTRTLKRKQMDTNVTQCKRSKQSWPMNAEKEKNEPGSLVTDISSIYMIVKDRTSENHPSHEALYVPLHKVSDANSHPWVGVSDVETEESLYCITNHLRSHSETFKRKSSHKFIISDKSDKIVKEKDLCQTGVVVTSLVDSSSSCDGVRFCAAKVQDDKRRLGELVNDTNVCSDHLHQYVKESKHKHSDETDCQDADIQLNKTKGGSGKGGTDHFNETLKEAKNVEDGEESDELDIVEIDEMKDRFVIVNESVVHDESCYVIEDEDDVLSSGVGLSISKIETESTESGLDESCFIISTPVCNKKVAQPMNSHANTSKNNFPSDPPTLMMSNCPRTEVGKVTVEGEKSKIPAMKKFSPIGFPQQLKKAAINGTNNRSTNATVVPVSVSSEDDSEDQVIHISNEDHSAAASICRIKDGMTPTASQLQRYMACLGLDKESLPVVKKCFARKQKAKGKKKKKKNKKNKNGDMLYKADQNRVQFVDKQLSKSWTFKTRCAARNISNVTYKAVPSRNLENEMQWPQIAGSSLMLRLDGPTCSSPTCPQPYRRQSTTTVPKSAHFRKLVSPQINHLSTMERIIFADLENFMLFKHMSGPWPSWSYLWGFISARPNSPFHLETYFCKFSLYEMLKANKCVHISTEIGTSKDAVDFAMTMAIAKLDDRLPHSIPFFIVSRDKGFLEVENQMRVSQRKVKILSPVNKLNTADFFL